MLPVRELSESLFKAFSAASAMTGSCMRSFWVREMPKAAYTAIVKMSLNPVDSHTAWVSPI